jgi:hypothetical protein
MLKRLLIYAGGFCLLVITAKAQNRHPEVFGKELSFTTENDAYLLQKRDAYYTNGLFFSLSKAGEKKGDKLIRSYQVGQMIFTPLSKKTLTPSDIDRPYCGLLFIKYAETRFHKNGSLFQYSGTLSELGPSSGGEGLQNGYHRLLGYTRFTGWQYQVRNAVGLDVGASYAQTILEDSSWIKLVPQAQLNLGTDFTNAGLGLYIVIGSFKKNSHSELWNARADRGTEAKHRKSELFLYWYPQVVYQGYNGTVEGGLLSKGKGAVLGSSEKWIFRQSIGVCYAAGRWSTRAAWVYQTREAVNQISDHQYGSFTLSYRLH